MSGERIALCGWCRSELPDTDDPASNFFEVQHHFLIAHGEPESQSVCYVYPEGFEVDFERWQARRAANGGRP